MEGLGLESDELALRRLLHQSVQEIEPADGTLEHLRRAVPARRARKRQAVVGMAAAALFIGTAIPALVHVSNSSGSDADPSIAGHGTHTQGSTQGKSGGGGQASSGDTSDKSKEKDKDDKKETPGKGKGESSGATGGVQPTPSAANTPACTAAQLSNAATVGSADAGGAVYGTFRISNVSGVSCTVTSAGSVTAAPQGAADASKIQVVQHTAGDAATGLPDPSTELASMILQPGTAYQVQFAWVPSETCPTTPDDPSSPQPTPTAPTTGGDSGGTSSEGTSGTAPQLATEGGVQDGSVVVSNTAEGGGPTASANVSNACAGTVYKTGVLAGQ
ncbi:hypothetical protein FGD71_018625 [Streptomyces sporangiiformans]|uniref:DUF4232 domain-containing protein n=1 Tax=Streptomyces sporangiiformans TaxID=2315329 RepID=A0A505DMW2_9ACTN|nr:hypothetical protein FGD71_018625 [Streptomyces sporangiiformans]